MIYNEMNAGEHILAGIHHTLAIEKQGDFVSTNDNVASQITNDCRTNTFLIIPMTIFIRYSTKLQIIAVRYIVRLPSHTPTRAECGNMRPICFRWWNKIKFVGNQLPKCPGWNDKVLWVAQGFQ